MESPLRCIQTISKHNLIRLLQGDASLYCGAGDFLEYLDYGPVVLLGPEGYTGLEQLIRGAGGEHGYAAIPGHAQGNPQILVHGLDTRTRPFEAAVHDVLGRVPPGKDRCPPCWC